MVDNVPVIPDASPAPTTPAAATPAKVEPTKATPVTKVDENGVAADAPKKIWKLKVNGKEMEYDASDEAKLQRDIQKVYGIEEKAKTAAEKASQAEDLMSMLSTDYKGFVKQAKKAGLDPDKLATDILYEKIRRDNMSPEQRELEEYKEREAEALKQKTEAEETAKKAEVTRKTQEWASKFEKDCEAALKANALPKTRLSLALIANYIDAGLQNKQELSVDQVLPYVARDLKEIHTSTMGRLEGEELLNYVGEELSNKIAKARVARYNKSQAITQPAQKPSTNPTTTKGEDISKLTGKAYWAALRRQKSEAGIGFLPGKE